MSSITQTVQEAFLNRLGSLVLPFEDSPNIIERSVRQALAKIHLRNCFPSICTAKFEILDQWTVSSAVHRVQCIPNKTWKRIALFVAYLILGYFWYFAFKTYKIKTYYPNLSFLIGVAVLLERLYKTFLYARSGSFPKVLKVGLSYQDPISIKHDRLANGIDKDGNIEDLFTLEPIPSQDLQSAKYLHLPNYILETISCIRGLLEKPELKHPIETGRKLSKEELHILLPQICRIFNLTEEEFLSCWMDVKVSDAEKLLLFQEKFQKNGLMVPGAMKVVEELFKDIVLERKNAIRLVIKQIASELYNELNYTDPAILSTIQTTRQLCLNSTSNKEFKENLSLFKYMLSCLPPLTYSTNIGTQQIRTEFNSTAKILQLATLQQELQNLSHSPSLFEPYQNRLHELFHIMHHKTPPSLQERINLVNEMILKEKAIESKNIHHLEQLSLSESLRPLFLVTREFQTAAKDLETNKRYQKFTALTGIELKSSDMSDTDAS